MSELNINKLEAYCASFIESYCVSEALMPLNTSTLHSSVLYDICNEGTESTAITYSSYTDSERVKMKIDNIGKPKKYAQIFSLIALIMEMLAGVYT
jgi:hypothetical protein